MSCLSEKNDSCMCITEEKDEIHESNNDCLESNSCTCRSYGPKLDGFVIPCLLMFLKQNPSHGYELYEKLTNLPFLKSLPDAGVIYRQLRRMKADGIVNSTLEPGVGGPARTVYSLTDYGEEYLLSCKVSLNGIKCSIENFFIMYYSYFENEKK